jgi:hypothetical protein
MFRFVGILCMFVVAAFAAQSGGTDLSGLTQITEQASAEVTKTVGIVAKLFFGLLPLSIGVAVGFMGWRQKKDKVEQDRQGPVILVAWGVIYFALGFIGSLLIVTIIGWGLTGEANTAVNAMNTFWKGILQ